MTTALARSLKTLRVPFEVKDVNEEAGTFSGLAATWDLDLGGDVIEKGAFRKTISDWKKSKGKAHNLLDSHDAGTIFSVLGGLLDAQETDAGVEGTWQFLKSQTGDAARMLVKSGHVTTMSIGYYPVVTRVPTVDEQKTGVWRFIKELRWVETSLVLFPMNPGATIDLATVKSLLAPGRDLTDLDRTELEVTLAQIKALLEKSAADAAPVLELAPDDTRRLALEEKVRDLSLRRLGIGL